MTEEIPKTSPPEEKEKDFKSNDPKEGGEIILERVKTYQDTIQEALRSQTMSGAKILMAEQKRREDRKLDYENKSLKTSKNKVFLAASIFLILIAVAVLIVTISTRPEEEKPQTGSVLTSSFFDPDKVIEVASTQLIRGTILKLQQVLSSPFPQNTVQRVVLTKEILADPESTLRLTKPVSFDTEDFLSLIEARAPEELRKSLERDFFLGIQTFNSNEPFLLFKVNNFENVFSGMFKWENNLVEDMEPVFFKNLSVLNKPETIIVPEPIVVSTTSTSTSLELPKKTTFNTRVFEDEVIGNTDARVIKDKNGNVIFFYTFVDEKYLFFGTTKEVFLETRKNLRISKLVL